MLASYVLQLFLPLATNAICPTTLPTDAAFATGAQYHAGDYGSASSIHLLSLSPSAPFSSFSLAYNLVSGSFMKTPSTQCPQACLNRLRAMGKPDKDGSSSSIIMMWDAAGQSPPATNILYAAYTTTVLPGEYLYCSNVAGTCGASVPLYLYYNSETDDYQLRNDKDTVDDAAARLQNMGLPVCWMFPALPSTSSSTSTVTNGTRIRLARGANESNATGKPNQILTDDLALPNSSKTEDQRSKINPPFENRTDRLPTVTSQFPAGHRTGTSSGTVSMDSKMEKGESAHSNNPYGDGGDLTSRDGSETATKISGGELSQTDVGKERLRDLLERGKNATGNGSVTESIKERGKDLLERGNNTTGSVAELAKEKGKDLLGWGTGSVADFGKGGDLLENGKNAAGNGSVKDQKNVSDIVKDHGPDKAANSADQQNEKQWGGVNLGSILGGLAGGLGGKAVDAIKNRFSAIRNVTLPAGNRSINEFEQKMKEKMEGIDKNKPLSSTDVNWKEKMEEIVKSYDKEKNSSSIEDSHEELEEKLMNKVGNGTKVVKKKWTDTNGHFAKALEALGIENMGNKEGSNETGVDELKKKSKENNGFIEKALASLGFDVGKENHENGSDLVKEKAKNKNMIEKALTSLGLVIPSNVSASGIMKERGKDKNGKIGKAWTSLGIDVPSNFSTSDLLKTLGKDDKDKHSDGKKFSVIDLLKLLGKDKIEKALTSLGIDMPSNFSTSDLMKTLGKDDKDNSSEGKKVSMIDLLKNLGKDKIEKALSSLGIVLPSNFSATELLKELGKDNGGGDFLHVLNASLNVLDEKKPGVVIFEKMNRTLNDAVNKDAVVAVEKILHRFNTSLAQVHPSFDDNNSSIVIATIPLPRKMNEQELAQARNETAEVKDVRVSEDRLSVYGGVEEKRDQKDVSVESGTWSHTGPTGETRGTRIGYDGTKRPYDYVNGTSSNPVGTRNQSGTRTSPAVTGGESTQSNQSNQTIQSVAIQIVTDSKGTSTTTSSGSSSTSTISGSTTTTVVRGVEGVSSTTTTVGSSSSGAYTGSSTTTTPYSGSPTTSTTAAPYTGPPTTSTTAAPYTGPPTTSTTPPPYTGPPTTSTTAAPYTGPPTTSTTAVPYTGPSTTADPSASTTTTLPGSSMTTVRPTTTTSPYVYSATTDAAGTYGPGDQKLENGTVIRPNGDTIFPNGTVKTGDGAIIEGGKKTDPDGTVHNPDGSTKYPNGTVVYPSDATPVTGGSGGGKSGDDTPTWVIPVIIVGSMIVGVGSLAMIVFGVTSMMKSAPPSTVNPYAVPNSREQWPNQRQPTPPSADLPPPVYEPVMTAQPQSFGATQTLAGGPNPLYFG